MPLSTIVRAAAAVAAFLAAGPARGAQDCGTVPLEPGIVRAVPDARTLVLEDGRTIRLDGIDALGPSVGEGGQGTRITAKLRELLVSKPARFMARSSERDRHGRLRAFVFVRPGLEASVQHDMVEQGLVRVAARGPGPACAAELFAREQEARAAGRGLWADPTYAVRQADDPASVLARRGHMALVEGQVLSVRESGGTIYVNFGRRWSQDFTVTIAKRSERAFAAAGLPPKRLERRRVRVRGWVEERGGPWIEATSPRQFEVLGAK